MAAPNPITGSNWVVVGNTTIFSNTTPGGSWSSGTPSHATINSSTGVITGVAVGASVITYTTGGGTAVKTIHVVLTPPAELSIVMSSQDSCCGGTNGGFACGVVSGGVAPYTYSWSPGGGTTQCITDIGNSDYNVIATDSLGDIVSGDVQVGTLPCIEVDLSINCNSTLTARVLNGFLPFYYEWFMSDDTPMDGHDSTSLQFPAGTYYCRVTDNVGCVQVSENEILTGIDDCDDIHLNFDICTSADCSTTSFIETTGSFSDSNLGGYGFPNDPVSEFTYAKMTIYDANGGLLYTYEFNGEIFPTIDVNFSYDITKLLDGAYRIVYYIATDNTNSPLKSYTSSIYKSIYCNVACCVNKMVLNIDFNCDCNIEAKNRTIDASLLLKGLKYSSGCGSLMNFNNQLSTLQKMCSNSGCRNCK